MHNSESGRKINSAVNQTTKAVGGAISTAKTTFSSWWTSITTATNSTADGEQLPEENDEPYEDIPHETIDETDKPIIGQIEPCIEADESVLKSQSIVKNENKHIDESSNHMHCKDDLDEIIQITADKIIEYAKEVDPDFKDNRQGKVFTV